MSDWTTKVQDEKVPSSSPPTVRNAFIDTLTEFVFFELVDSPDVFISSDGKYHALPFVYSGPFFLGELGVLMVLSLEGRWIGGR